MKIMPNLSNRAWVSCVLIGLALVVGPFIAGLDAWHPVAVPILGLASIAGDCDVDLFDWSIMQLEFTGPSVPQ